MTSAAAGRRSHTVRQATKAEDRALTDVLSRSFWDDPVMTWLLPDDRTRYNRQRHFYKMELSATRKRGSVLTTDDLAGAALWLPPGKWRTPYNAVVAHAIPMLLALGRRIPTALGLLQHIEAAHPKEPHWYLAILGTDPVRQGFGVGGALITEITERADREGVGAYLESSKAANVPYYERFGFTVTGEVTASGGPTLWTMWRDPG